MGHLSKFHKIKRKDYPGEIRSEWLKKQKSEAMLGSKNPGWKHGGRFSPFSKKFINGDVSGATLKKANKTRSDSNNDTTKIEYWLKKSEGNIDKAKELLSNRQSTFSLEKCIEKYGEVNGKEKWKLRQHKWQTTLNSKSPEEIQRINKSKTFVCKNDLKVGYNSKDYLEKEEEATLYLFKYHPANKEKEYIKFGITKRPLHRRWKQIYNKETILLYKAPANDIFILEQMIKRFCHNNNLITDDFGFSGWSECVELENKGRLQEFIDEIIKHN